MDPYATLGVTKTATQDEIKNAYRKLAKSLHPDLNPGNKDNETKFKQVAAAYEILGDPEKRKKYDEGPPEGQREHPFYQNADRHFYYESAGPQSYSEGFSFEDLFSGFSQQQRGPRGKRPPRDELYVMEIDLREAVQGAEKEITLPNGKHLKVKIPAGVVEGTKLRFAGQGANGDALVELHFRESPEFQRHGEDLETELPVSPGEVVSNASVRVPTLTGAVLLNIPAGANAGTRLRIRGKGLPKKGAASGDLFVRLKIVLPTVMDDALKAAILENEKRHPFNPRESLSGAAA